MFRYIETIFVKLKERYEYKLYLFLAMALYSIIYSIVELTIYRSFFIYTWDLGIFNQALWNTLHGRFLYYTVEPFYTRTGSFLGTHFSPILVLVLPFYALLPRPEALLVMSTMVIALGAIPAYGIAKHFLKDDRVAVTLGIFYLLYLPLQGVTFSGFSLEAIAVTLFLFIIYFLIEERFIELTLFVVLGLMTLEATAPVIAFTGLYGMWHYKSIKTKGFQASLVILISSALYFVFAQEMRIFFGWTGHPSFWNEWSIVGATGPADLPFKVIMNPAGAWNALTFDLANKTLFLLFLLLPAAFLPLWGIEGLIPAVPFLFISLFSSYSTYYSVLGHYPAFLVPFFFVALILGIKRFGRIRRFPISTSKLTKLTFLVSIVSLTILFPTIYSEFINFSYRGEYGLSIYEYISYIPKNASVLTQNNIFPHLSNRHDAYTIPSPKWNEEYARLANETLQNLKEVNVDYVLIDLKSDPYSAAGGELILNEFVLANSNYKLLAEKDGVMLFKYMIT